MSNRKRGKQRKNLITAIVALVAVLALCIGLCVYLETARVAPDATVEVGTQSVDPKIFLGYDKSLAVSFITDMSAIDMSRPGDHPVRLDIGGKTYKSVLKVRDTVAPQGTAVDQTVLAGKALLAENFVKDIADATNVTVSFEKQPDPTQKQQNVTLVLKDEGGNTTRLNAFLTIEFDEVQPTIEGAADRKVWLGAAAYDFLYGVSAKDDKDPEPKLTCDSSNVNFQVAGRYTVIYTATDSAGNTAQTSVKITVEADKTVPKIHGAKDLYAYVGGTVAYRTGVTVSDDMDTAPKLTVDSSSVNIMKAGTYYITYTGTDGSGNKASQTVKLTVLKKPTALATQEQIDTAVNGILNQIIRDNMTDKQKVTAIYNWARGNMSYSNHSDKADWQQAGYQGIKNRTGDCFTYYAVTKLMLDKLGIPNLDVVKVKNHSADSNHYWSLVSVDGGKTYYHFDATPRVGSGDDFCLVTDAFLDAYSKAHSNCHNRDKSLYPATPTTPAV